MKGLLRYYETCQDIGINAKVDSFEGVIDK
jgi:hypothetical protein